jgi:Mg2+ and Co2+ transporter CorA
MLAACFFPVATLAAIFGVNLHHGMEGWEEQYAPFPMLAILGGGFLLGIILMLLIRRKS